MCSEEAGAENTLTALDRAAQWLHDAGIPYHKEQDCLYITGFEPDGFDISITRQKDGAFLFWCEGWQDFDFDEAQVQDFLKWVLSSQCRLLVKSRGARPCEWVLQKSIENDWHVFSSISRPSYLFWKRATVAVFQNRWL